MGLAQISPETKHYARLLYDSKGMYGLRIDNPQCHEGSRDLTIVARQDRIHGDGVTIPTLFHVLPRRHASWAKGSEADAAYQLLCCWLMDRGFKPGEMDLKDAELRKTYHSLKTRTRQVVSVLVRELYTAAIPENHLRLLLRYTPNYRGRLFRELRGERAWQLAETFPTLAAWIFDHHNDDEVSRRCLEAQQLVTQGAKLADVANAIGMPIQLRRFPPCVLNRVERVLTWLVKHPDVVAHHAPDTVPRMRAWLSAITYARETDDEYAVWVARHWSDLGNWRNVDAVVRDVADWVHATCTGRAALSVDVGELRRVVDALRMGSQEYLALGVTNWYEQASTRVIVGRPFSSAMAARTVLRLSEDWHNRTAEAKAADVPFPQPWYSGGTVKTYRIEPVSTSPELSRFGYALHNCASQYAHEISGGQRFIYVVFDESRTSSVPVAMLELTRNDDNMPQLHQLAGPCNAKVAKPIENAVRTWLRQRRKVEGAGQIPESKVAPFDDDIPF